MLPTWDNNEGIVAHYCVLRLSTTHIRKPMKAANSKREGYHGKE